MKNMCDKDRAVERSPNGTTIMERKLAASSCMEDAKGTRIILIASNNVLALAENVVNNKFMRD